MDVKRTARRKMRRGAWIPLAFLLPHLLVFCCFNVFPILTGIFASFTKWRSAKRPYGSGWKTT